MPDKKIQEKLFQQLKAVMPPGMQLVDAVADILHLSTDSAYRRIRGETPLVLEEAQALCHHYHLSLDALVIGSTGTVSFKVMSINGGDAGFEQYWQNLLLAVQGIASFRQKEIIYLSKDMPFFHNFCFPELFAFRHFFWMKSILQHPGYTHQLFSFDCLTPTIAATGRAILATYNQISSTEIWNTESLNSTLSQVEHFSEAGYFRSRDDLHLLYDALYKTVEHVQAETEAGCKFLPGENPDYKSENFKVFYNRVVLGDNTILILHDGYKTVYLNYDVLNYMYTHDEAFGNEVYGKVQTLMRRATILSKESEKQRTAFFNSLYQRIEKSKQSIL